MSVNNYDVVVPKIEDMNVIVTPLLNGLQSGNTLKAGIRSGPQNKNLG